MPPGAAGPSGDQVWHLPIQNLPVKREASGAIGPEDHSFTVGCVLDFTTNLLQGNFTITFQDVIL